MQAKLSSAVGAILLVPGLAYAQSADALAAQASPVTANVTLTSNYKFRG
ncbi:MAG: hypothetical protein JSS56_26650, partial [Proteobacteria bacterium]|nr:hypothetical protein [Pseudomonadota bacterium]